MVLHSSPRLLCSHGGALFYIAGHPDCTGSDLADALFVTPRTVWGLIGELKRAGLIIIRKEGRRHHYSIREDAPFPDPLFSDATIGQFFQSLQQKPPKVDPGPLRREAHIVADHANADLIGKCYDAFRKKDLATLGSLFAENAIWHVAGTSPISGTYQGRDVVSALFRRVEELSGGTFQIEVHTVLADDEHAVVLTQATASREGKRLRVQGVNVFHVHDGKITEVWQASEDQTAIDEFWS